MLTIDQIVFDGPQWPATLDSYILLPLERESSRLRWFVLSDEYLTLQTGSGLFPNHVQGTDCDHNSVSYDISERPPNLA
jgi:hypothetical protein